MSELSYQAQTRGTNTDLFEVLPALGFGVEEPDICTKIPSHFISCPSTAKSINIKVFIDAQRQCMVSK
uniref:ITPR-interacting domain-containing protein n=1 Tax=Laticauda laticaudata TaxID=8630 RepID=A0A8C5SI38_LATLA